MDRRELFRPSRIDVNNSITAAEAQEMAKDPRLEVVQTVAPLAAATWALLDDQIFTRRPDVQLRVYGHYQTRCDLALTRLVPHVRRFAADSLRRVLNVEALGDLRQLESLSVGVYELESFEFLTSLPTTITSLSLGQTKSKKPKLWPLERFSSLRSLYLESQSSDIHVLSSLHQLGDVTLRSITVPDLVFLSGLDCLWSLDIKLGGTTDLRAIHGMTGIKYLELWQIRGLPDVAVVAELPGLQNVFLQSLPNVTRFPSLKQMTKLRRVVVENMKGLNDFTELEAAPALEDFALIDGRGRRPEDLLPVLRNATIRRVTAGFGSQRKNEAFADMREKHGKEPLGNRYDFDYR